MSGGAPTSAGGGEPADGGFRLFPSDLDGRRRRVYRAVLVFYLAATAGLVWPVYAAFGGIRPVVLGIPFSLFYVIVWVVASFLVLLGLYLWEGRLEGDGEDRGAAAGGDGPDPSAPRTEG